MKTVTIIGGGLAGVEAAWAAAKLGCNVTIYEMRPYKSTPAHKTPFLAELVCSNSLKSSNLDTAAGLLKEEMRRLGSIVLEVAYRTRVPAGSSLAVDRLRFSKMITDIIESHPRINVIRAEVKELPDVRPVVIATGPLTSDDFASYLKSFLGEDYLYFYDAISPIVDGETIDYNNAFWGDRYSKGSPDYLNCPLTEKEYDEFYEALIKADLVEPHDFEDRRFFEACMPIEELARRGKQTLLFGPMKPVGLVDPRTGKTPYAVVQLRKEDNEGRMFNMVGFQTRMKWTEQKRVFRLIPALKKAEFLRYGSIHRNTYINSPKLLDIDLSFKKDKKIFFAGQLTGVEGYLESASVGIIAGINAARVLEGYKGVVPPSETIIGSLIRYITTKRDNFQPMNANFGLLPSIKIKNKKKRKLLYAERAISAIEAWLKTENLMGLRHEVV